MSIEHTWPETKRKHVMSGTAAGQAISCKAAHLFHYAQLLHLLAVFEIAVHVPQVW